jgi:demethylmenaquinone methyltransferase / 2-methoxy-6-polyprenyl-1,4-benzoquinol methylase
MHEGAIRPPPTRFALGLFAGLPSRYDRLASLLSLGQDRRWRREMIDHVVPLEAGLTLDVATGPAGVAIDLSKRLTGLIVGVDLSADMLEQGRRNVTDAQLRGRIALVRGQGECLPFPDASFDALTFTYLLRYVADPAATLAELARVVRPGGAVASLEFAVPPNVWWRWSWRLYTRLVLPLAGAVLGGRPWFDVGRFLGPNIEDHYRKFPVHAAVQAWEAAGFTDVGLRRMSLGGGLVMWGRRDTAARPPQAGTP